MILVDEALRRREAEGRPVRVAMVGAGFMGRGIANQIVNSVPGLALVAISNRTLDRAVQAYTEAGQSEPRAVTCVLELEDCIRAGRLAVTDDPMLLCEADGIDCLSDASGALELGARGPLAPRGTVGGRLRRAEVRDDDRGAHQVLLAPASAVETSRRSTKNW